MECRTFVKHGKVCLNTQARPPRWQLHITGFSACPQPSRFPSAQQQGDTQPRAECAI
ncbi:hypothetical protein B0H12DRAFT_1136498 [Mycena haematopus]|nr:hypothetical protein B0H12DRAFT_1136498 [Mycena haematopus]